MKKEWWMRIIAFAVLAIFLLLFAFSNKIIPTEENKSGLTNENYCLSNSDCIPASCCHPKTCATIAQAPNCNSVICSEVCEPETLDCGQGSCACVNNKCATVLI